MIPALDPLRLTAFPAAIFIAWLPLFLLVPARRTRAFFVAASIATLVLVEGPLLAVALVLVILAAYFLVEAVAALRSGRRTAAIITWILLHLLYWACFHLPLPAPFESPHLRASDGPGVFILFTGIGLTFFRLLSYFGERMRQSTPRLTLGDYLGYMLYFPQFRHGPIERAHEFVDQLHTARTRWTRRDLALGCGRLGAGLAGLLAALAVRSALSHSLPQGSRADPLALLSSPDGLSLPQLLLLIHLPAVFFYLVESSYAHIQLGVSRVFGVCGAENFNLPFLASDPRELWHRWNITLSAWLRDFAYIPLGGNRRHKYLNLILVFVYCSLLHGLQPRCLAWGLWTGCTLAAYAWLRDTIQRTPPAPKPRQHHLVLRFAARTLARLATFHWFSIGVTIIIDPQYCGLRVLRQYVTLLLRALGLT